MPEAGDTAGPAGAGLKAQVAEVINMIRPALQGDGGDIELIDVNDQGVVRVRLHGACVGCPSARMTLAYGVENNLKERVPGVTGLICEE